MWTVAPCLGSTHSCLLSYHGNHSHRGLSHLLCLVPHSHSLWTDESLGWSPLRSVLRELAFELKHQAFYSWLLHGQTVSLKVYIQKTWTWIMLRTFSNFSCLELYYMVPYSSAHGHGFGFVLPLDRSNIDVWWVTFCRCLAQTNQKRTSSVQRNEI